jgi:hypothetical protein
MKRKMLCAAICATCAWVCRSADAQTTARLAEPAGREAASDPTVPTVWGKEANGLAASVRPVRNTFPRDRKIELEVFLKNVSRKEVAVLGWGRQLSPSTWRVRLGPYEHGRGQPQLVSLTLRPGETKSVVLSLPAAEAVVFSANRSSERVQPATAKHSALPEGTYKVKVGYFGRDSDCSGPFDGNDVESNEVEIRIGPVDASENAP